MIESIRSISIEGKHGKPILADLFFVKNETRKPVIIFSHGFKGFKDWGPFNLMAEKFAEEGFVFVKFNFSHNGTTLQQPEEFVDLEAFGNNNLLKELEDLGSVIDFIMKPNIEIPGYLANADINHVHLMGHSRGGGITILKGASDERIHKIVTLASLSRFGAFFSRIDVEDWKKQGVMWVENSRTKQKLPMYYQYYEAIRDHADLLNIAEAVRHLRKPLLIIHGSDDESVPVENAKLLNEWNNNATELLILKGANHTFGARHPWPSSELPPDFNQAMVNAIRFLKSKSITDESANNH